VQLNSLTGNVSVRDLAAEGAYVNRARRWNWGLVGGQIPYLSGGFESGLARVGGRLVGIDRLIVNRQTERSASGLVAYPFDRARRIEFQGGLTEVSFDQTVQTTVYDPFTGGVLSVDTTTSPLARPLTLATSSAAFVTDTSNFGATSPVSGSRARLEIGPTFGTIAYTGVLGDYRRYFMPAPFYTFAVRGLHYGRYGSGGEDARLFPLYLGFPSLVRGYDVNSFDARDCVPDAASTCPAFDRLMGSRMLVGNVEFRFPLLRPFGASRGMYGPLPVEVAFFADGGVAWTRGDAPAFLGGSRTGVSSAGVALRVSLFGFAVGELDLVRPFQRVNRGWLIQFNLLPGF
jgi:outer membrane protein assembly factor BamA